MSELVAQPSQQLPLGKPGTRQPGRPHPLVVGIRANRDEARSLERAEEAAEVARVEPELRPQRTHIAAVRADLPQDARLAERPRPREVVVVEGTDRLDDDPV